MRIVRKIRNTFALSQLSPVARALIDDRLTYLSPEKLARIQKAISRTRTVPGDVIEFGVALGGSGIILAESVGDSRRFFGFDVFGMIPPPTSDKDDVVSKERYEHIKAGKSVGINGDEYYGYKEDLYSTVCAAFDRYGVPVDGEKIILRKGLFQEVWPTTNVRTISLVHIDCDWYDPVKFALNAAADKMSRGGIMIIDDFHDYAGCRIAVDEFLKAHGDFSYERGRNPFLIKMK